jgi:hypothetical protein
VWPSSWGCRRRGRQTRLETTARQLGLAQWHGCSRLPARTSGVRWRWTWQRDGALTNRRERSRWRGSPAVGEEGRRRLADSMTRRRPARGDGGGVSGGVSAETMMTHSGTAHLARRGQAAVVHGIPIGSLGSTSDIGASQPRPLAALTRGRRTWPGGVVSVHTTDRAPRSTNQHTACGRLAADRWAPHASAFSK